MNPVKFDSTLREVQRYLGNRREVKSALVYGSVAVGTAGAESDVDLLIVAPRDFHEELARDLYRIGARYDATVSPYLVEWTELESLDPQFLESVARDGIVLQGKPLDPSVRALQLEPFQLVTLQLDRLSQREKVRLSRELYGYSSERKYKRTRYRSRKRGFLERVGGRKLGRGTFLVPSRSWPELEALLQKRGGQRWAFTVWLQPPG